MRVLSGSQPNATGSHTPLKFRSITNNCFQCFVQDLNVPSTLPHLPMVRRPSNIAVVNTRTLLGSLPGSAWTVASRLIWLISESLSDASWAAWSSSSLPVPSLAPELWVSTCPSPPCTPYLSCRSISLQLAGRSFLESKTSILSPPPSCSEEKKGQIHLCFLGHCPVVYFYAGWVCYQLVLVLQR